MKCRKYDSEHQCKGKLLGLVWIQEHHQRQRCESYMESLASQHGEPQAEASVKPQQPSHKICVAGLAVTGA